MRKNIATRGMWITRFRVSDSYHISLIWTRGKYENQTSGNIFWKREEMSKGQSNKIERIKLTLLTLVILIVSYL